jgi:hypothetical protein
MSHYRTQLIDALEDWVEALADYRIEDRLHPEDSMDREALAKRCTRLKSDVDRLIVAVIREEAEDQRP